MVKILKFEEIRPIDHFKPVQQKRQLALGAYCSNIYYHSYLICYPNFIS